MAVDREALAEETITTLAKVEIWGAIDVTKQGKYIVGVCVKSILLVYMYLNVFQRVPTKECVASNVTKSITNQTCTSKQICP